MKKILLFISVLFCIFITGCDETKKSDDTVNKSKSLEIAVDENSALSIEENSTDVKVDIETVSVPNSNSDYANHPDYFNAKILIDDVNVREYPSASSESVYTAKKDQDFTVTAFSYKTDVIDGEEGFWVLAHSSEEENFFSQGWIFSKYLSLPENIKPSIMEIDKLEDYYGYVKVKRNIPGAEECTLNVEVSKSDNQDFSVLRLYSYVEGFSFTDVPGTYVYKNGEINYISWYGDSDESAWVNVSDDMKYIFQDFGTGPGVRGLEIFDVENEKIVFSGSYYDSINYSGNEVTIAVPVREYMSNVDEESLSHVTKFIKENPKTDNLIELENQGLSVTPVVFYRFDYVNEVRTFEKCDWVLEQ